MVGAPVGLGEDVVLDHPRHGGGAVVEGGDDGGGLAVVDLTGFEVGAGRGEGPGQALPGGDELGGVLPGGGQAQGELFGGAVDGLGGGRAGLGVHHRFGGDVGGGERGPPGGPGLEAFVGGDDLDLGEGGEGVEVDLVQQRGELGARGHRGQDVQGHAEGGRVLGVDLRHDLRDRPVQPPPGPRAIGVGV